MRLSRPRFTITIMSMMIVVVIASLLLTALVALRERNRRIAALQVATAEYEVAELTRKLVEDRMVEVDGLESELARAKADELGKKAHYEQLKAAATKSLLWW